MDLDPVYWHQEDTGCLKLLAYLAVLVIALLALFRPWE